MNEPHFEDEPNFAYRIRSLTTNRFDGDYSSPDAAINALNEWQKRYPLDNFEITFLDVTIDYQFWWHRKAHGEALS